MAYEPVVAAFRPSRTETCVAKITGLLAFGESHRKPKCGSLAMDEALAEANLVSSESLRLWLEQ
jgi:hypothetical protein